MNKIPTHSGDCVSTIPSNQRFAYHFPFFSQINPVLCQRRKGTEIVLVIVLEVVISF